MSELARVLRDARKVQNIALDEAERATKIRRRYLEAIEAGDFDQLPDGPPARGFVKNYARFLSLDGDQAIADFEAEFGVPVINAREHIPPPPNHSRQRRRSSYTQLEAPRLHYKGRLPAPNSPELDGYDPRDERARDERNERDRDNQPSGFSRSAIGGNYNLGFDDDDEMARYRPRNYRMDEEGRDNEGQDSRDGGREGSRRRVLPPLKQRLRANKSSFRLQGKSGPPKGMSLSSGVPEISTILPSKSRMGGMSRSAVNLQLPQIPQQVFAVLGGLVAIGALAALVVMVILPAIRTSSVFSGLNTPAATRAASSQIAVTIMAPIKPANTPVPQGQTVPDTSTGVLPNTNINTNPGANANPDSTANPQDNTVPAPVAVPASTDGIQLALDAREHAWVRVKVDGNVVYESMPPIGPTMTWSAKNKISIETGNAGAFEAIVNGVRTGAVGQRNTVARKVWDLSGQAKDGE